MGVLAKKGKNILKILVHHVGLVDMYVPNLMEIDLVVQRLDTDINIDIETAINLKTLFELWGPQNGFFKKILIRLFTTNLYAVLVYCNSIVRN